MHDPTDEPVTEPVPGSFLGVRTSLHHLVQERSDSDSAALTDRDRTCSYAELWDLVSATASGLRRLGLDRLDRVAVYLDKRVETVATVLGASAAGCVFVPVNPVLKAGQVAHILGDCSVRTLITSPERLAVLAEALPDLPALEHVVLVGEASSTNAAGAAVSTWSDLVSNGVGPRHPTVDTVDADVAAILYTSGSTGLPKGVVLSHRNLIVGAESVSGYLGNRADDVILAALPLSFDAGLSQLTTAFSAGAHVVLHNYLLPRDAVRACEKYGVTGLTCVPPLWLQIVAADWPPEVAGRLRYFANTGGRMPRSILARLRELFPAARPFLMYGLTEAFRSTYLDPDEVDARPDSIGKAIPNAEILVVGPDGLPCGPGEEGELVHRGALVALGYWNDPERTAERFRPAPGRLPGVITTELAVWSGDTVTTDDDGFLYFVGRSDDMIKTSGYRVSPTELEEAAYDTGLVGDVVALGLPDDRLGHRVAIVATASAGSSRDELSAALVKRLRQTLPLYMVPAEVHVRDELPRSPNGKFDRVQMREELL